MTTRSFGIAATCESRSAVCKDRTVTPLTRAITPMKPRATARAAETAPPIGDPVEDRSFAESRLELENESILE